MRTHPHPAVHEAHAAAKRHRRVRRRRRRHHHSPVHHTPAPAPKPVVRPPAPKPVTPPLPPPKPVPPPAPPSDLPVYSGPFTARQAERLLWRAGFGPRPGQAQQLASLGLTGAVQSLTRPSGAATLTGPAPLDEQGQPIAPADSWGHDHMSWLDRMVRSNQSLVERMALIWHDWFATSNAGVGSQQKMLDQANLFRTRGLGSFSDLLRAVTTDPAMLLWLNGVDNRAGETNENYGRELMELFTLGADRGAYTETEVREMARALTGWRRDWSAELGDHNFRYDASWHDTGTKRIFGQTANFDWQDACRLCVSHPLHASFFVRKLWSYFVPSPPSATTQASLERLYTSSGFAIRPVVEAILVHPDLYLGGVMVKPPVVFAAGMLRATGQGIATDAWSWYADDSGQRLFYPPNVAGWDDSRWLDTSTLRGRWMLALSVLRHIAIDGGLQTYDKTETPAQALAAASSFWGQPTMSPETQQALLAFAGSALPDPIYSWQESPLRAQRQNALRHLIATCPDLQTS